MANEVNINKTTNTVNVTNEQTKVIRVTAQGPQGQKGDIGPTGPQGPQGISAFSGSAESSSISIRLTTAESELNNTLISSSAQIASDISGSFTAGTGVTISSGQISIGQSVGTSDSPTFSGLTTTGDIVSQGNVIGQNYIVSSSITYMTQSFSSGSTIFGDSIDDTHQFTGSVSISGSIVSETTTLISGSAQIASDISGSFTNLSSSLSTRLTTDETNITNLQTDSGSFSTRITIAETELNNTLISGSAQVVSSLLNQDVDLGTGDLTSTTGSFGRVEATTISASRIDVDATTLFIGTSEINEANAAKLSDTLLSGSVQIASDISGSFTQPSSSFSTRVTTLETDLSTEKTNIDNLQTDSGSFSTRITATESELGNTLIGSSTQITELGFISESFSTSGTGILSSSIQIASDISGSFTEASASFSTRITTAETELSNTLISSSAQISSDISGSFVQPSSSFSTRVTTLETDLSTEQTNIDNLQTDSGSFSTRITTNETNISNLQTDSGSFSTRITNAETELNNTLISSSVQIASDISGSFVQPSSSFSTRVTTLEGIPFISSSTQIASDISGSFTAGTGVTISSG